MRYHLIPACAGGVEDALVIAVEDRVLIGDREPAGRG